VTLTVRPINDAPVIQSIAVSGDKTTIVWSAIPGKVYTVEYKSDFSETTWDALPGYVTASSTSATIVDQIDSPARRFYRIVVLP
jgi:hypothetical protein